MNYQTISKENKSASFPVVKLKPGIPHRAHQKHLWIYKTEIEQYNKLQLETGSFVDVLDEKGNYLGCGFFSTSSEIAVRLFSFEKVMPDRKFWYSKIKQAVDYRNKILPSLSSKRLINSESDFLPGVIVDQYGDILVLQTLTQGADKLKNVIVEVLCELLKPIAIFEQNNASSRKRESLPERVGVLYGSLPDNCYVKIGDISYDFNRALSHKTAFYLDQQQNYKIIKGLVREGMKVLDLFSYAGGFALHTLLNGADEVVAVDTSSDALNICKLAADRIGKGEKLKLLQKNAFDFLKELAEQDAKFDFIILDPPSFTKTRKHIREARRGYKELHIRACNILKEGGVLATFCCSHHISQSMFRDYICEAANDAHKILRRELILTQAPDHPVLSTIPETEYLKGFVFNLMA